MATISNDDMDSLDLPIVRKRRYKKYEWEKHPELRRAVQLVVQGDSFHRAYTKTGVIVGTIRKFYRLYVTNKPKYEEAVKCDQSNEIEISNNEATHSENENIMVFTPEQEIELMKYIKTFEYLFYGSSDKECRMLAYQMVINEDMKIPVGWKQGMASVGWLTSFQLRHSSFVNNLEKPDRLTAHYKSQRSRILIDQSLLWEKKTVATFYDDLEMTIQKNPLLKDKKRIYSLDEVYTSINPEMTSADRESNSDLLTTCCIICADGTCLPPVIVKPYLPFDVCSEIPTGAAAFIGCRGRMTPDLFTEVMQHFIKHSSSSLSNPSILIMDTDLCHLSYAAIKQAKESGVTILTIHPHVNVLLQPLQGVIFESFHKSFQDAMHAWWITQEKQSEVPCDIGKFVTEAYLNAMTFDNIVNGFTKCGISPFDRDLFNETDFKSCLQSDYACIECRLRDDRSKKLTPEKSDEDVQQVHQVRDETEKSRESQKKPFDEKIPSRNPETQNGDPVQSEW